MHHIQGYNGDVDIAAAEDIISLGGDATFPAAAAATTVKSGDANDTAAGTGARTVRVYGLNSALAPIQEDATLNGTTAVDLTNQFLRVNKMEILTAGSGLTNAGLISALHSATTIHTIVAGIGLSRWGIFTPWTGDGLTWRIRNIQGHLVSGTTGSVTMHLMTKKSGGLWQVRYTFGLNATGSSSFRHEFAGKGMALDAGEDVRIRAALVSADNALIAAGADVTWS